MNIHICVCIYVCKWGREDKRDMDVSMYIGKIVGGGVGNDADPLDLPKEWSACPHSPIYPLRSATPPCIYPEKFLNELSSPWTVRKKYRYFIHSDTMINKILVLSPNSSWWDRFAREFPTLPLTFPVFWTTCRLYSSNSIFIRRVIPRIYNTGFLYLNSSWNLFLIDNRIICFYISWPSWRHAGSSLATTWQWYQG